MWATSRQFCVASSSPATKEISGYVQGTVHLKDLFYLEWDRIDWDWTEGAKAVSNEQWSWAHHHYKGIYPFEISLTTTANTEVYTWWWLQVDTYHIQVQSNYGSKLLLGWSLYYTKKNYYIMQQQNDYMVHFPKKLLCSCLVLIHSMWLRELSSVYWLPQIVTV